jgi:hypothetical protein
VLIGDIYQAKRYAYWLFMFKVMYYAGSLLHFKSSFMAWRQRKRSVKYEDIGVTG